MKPHLLSPKLTLEPPLPALLSPTSCPGIFPPAILLFLFCNQEPEKQIEVKSGEYVSAILYPVLNLVKKAFLAYAYFRYYTITLGVFTIISGKENAHAMML